MSEKVKFTPEGSGKIWQLFQKQNPGGTFEYGMDFIINTEQQKAAGWEPFNGPKTLAEAQEFLKSKEHQP